ncbi:hypothetical protein CASFOL_018363 [Castilleja foliolosa]|uniref:Uncharacterized protein n=1 Tax=Castilleja foliolosa TaxID=1961234 RepID=A0ABD3DAJ9_9LAMI
MEDLKLKSAARVKDVEVKKEASLSETPSNPSDEVSKQKDQLLSRIWMHFFLEILRTVMMVQVMAALMMILIKYSLAG